MSNNRNGIITRGIVTLITGLLIVAIIGLIALRDTVRANSARLDNTEPKVEAVAKETKAVAEDISEIKLSIKEIETVLKYQQKGARP